MVLDCIPCEKCRLWGKIQFLGMGTALKILLSDNEVPLTRAEIVALINTLGRLSESVNALVEFFESKLPGDQLFDKELKSTVNLSLVAVVAVTALLYSVAFIKPL